MCKLLALKIAVGLSLFQKGWFTSMAMASGRFASFAWARRRLRLSTLLGISEDCQWRFGRFAAKWTQCWPVPPASSSTWSPSLRYRSSISRMTCLLFSQAWLKGSSCIELLRVTQKDWLRWCWVFFAIAVALYVKFLKPFRILNFVLNNEGCHVAAGFLCKETYDLVFLIW